MSDCSKNYPDSKNNEDNEREFEEVYAGPGGTDDEAPDVRDDPGMCCVYAGPEMFDRVAPEKKPPEKKPKKRSWWPFRKREKKYGGVYAGPQMMKRSGFAKVYAGPPVKEPKDREPNEFEDVYAGPEFFENPGREEDPSAFEAVYAGPEDLGEPEPSNDAGSDEPEPEEPAAPVYAGPDPSVISGVYAGPAPAPDQFGPVYAGPPVDQRQFMAAYAGPPTDSRQYMMVYAGPAQMSDPSRYDSRNTAGIFFGGPFSAGTPASAADQINPNSKKCEKCGALMPNDYKFCGYCGKPFPKQAFCPACGAPVEENQKFCKECGTVLK